MDKLSQISLENTVTVKIDCLLDQELLAKNFAIIIDCLKDLKSQQDKNNSEINNLACLREIVNSLKNNQSSQTGDNSHMDSLLQKIEKLKTRMAKNEESTNDNTRDVNLLLKDMKEAKQQIQNLKKQLNSISLSALGNQQKDSKNLSQNTNLSQQILNNLNNQAQQHDKELKRLEKQMQKMRQKMSLLEQQLNELKSLQQQPSEIKIDNTGLKNDNNNTNIDQKALSDIMKRLQFLTKKSENLQNNFMNNTRCINELHENNEKTKEEMDGLKDNLDTINSEIQEVNKMLQQLKKNNAQNNTQNNAQKDNNNNMAQVFVQIQRLKQKYENLLKAINELKNAEKSDNSSSVKSIQKNSQQRSFRKRSDSVDYNAKIRELSERIKFLQKHLNDDNPQKLPSIAWKKGNQTAYNNQKSHKKEMSEMKNDLEIWIRSYIDSMGRNNGGNLVDLELKIQQIKNLLHKKADHEGMKKGLAFLEGKITQLYLFLTEPESEDAMIVRKGFNCLSCSKKVENLRGKLGPRMNWDNLNTTHFNHTPPKTGFPKYADNERDSI